jgi:hypothetical protein
VCRAATHTSWPTVSSCLSLHCVQLSAVSSMLALCACERTYLANPAVTLYAPHTSMPPLSTTALHTIEAPFKTCAALPSTSRAVFRATGMAAATLTCHPLAPLPTEHTLSAALCQSQANVHGSSNAHTAAVLFVEHTFSSFVFPSSFNTVSAALFQPAGLCSWQPAWQQQRSRRRLRHWA